MKRATNIKANKLNLQKGQMAACCTSERCRREEIRQGKRTKFSYAPVIFLDLDRSIKNCENCGYALRWEIA